MSDTFVYPPRNLPGRAEDWGRAVEARDKLAAKELTQAVQRMDNGLRATSGQLAVIAEQINTVTAQQEILSAQQATLSTTVSDLQSRSTSSTAPSDLTLIRGASSGESGPATRAVAFPAPVGGRRNAIVVGSGSVAWTGTSTGTGIGDSVTVGLEFRQAGTRVWYDNTSASSAQMFTFMGSNTFNLVVPLQVPSGGSSYDLRMWVGATSSGGQVNRGARLENMNFSIIYGDTY